MRELSRQKLRHQPLTKVGPMMGYTRMQYGVSRMAIAVYTFLVVALFSFISSAQAKPLWITAACFSLNMSVFDKLGSSKNEHIVFHVTSSDGTVYVSKMITSNIGDISVSFPKDFIYEKAQLPANVDCNNGSKYDWKILVENNLIDSGTVEFKRNKLK